MICPRRCRSSPLRLVLTVGLALAGFVATATIVTWIESGVLDHRERKLHQQIKSSDGDSVDNETVSYDVHVFYYAWYGSPEFDGGWRHWNHELLPDWHRPESPDAVPEKHKPENDDIGASFFPQLGPYSSRDPAVVAEHMRQIRASGAGVLAVSWYPPGLSDPNGKPSDERVTQLLDAAHEQGLKVALHMEPYEGRTPESVRRDLRYVVDTHASHPAFYKRKVGRRELPVYYVYDSYRTSSDSWQRLLSSKGDLSIRGTDLDAIFLALLVEFQHRAEVKAGKFDGFYTYFAADGFSHGSSFKNWKSLYDFSQRNSLLFVPSVGPGYDDTRIRPWNGENTRRRKAGTYYGMGWRALLQFAPKLVSITSFNEWHEGTQIETAVPKATKNNDYTYLSYEPEKENFYLLETRTWVQKYNKAKNN